MPMPNIRYIQKTLSDPPVVFLGGEIRWTTKREDVDEDLDAEEIEAMLEGAGGDSDDDQQVTEL